MPDYAFDNTNEVSAARLTALEAVCDPITCRQFDRVCLSEGWSCLEIGAGNGSMAQEMLRRVGHSGRVAVTDIDIRFLSEASWSRQGNVTLLQHDITTEPIPNEEYDLIHARNVFLHLPSARVTLARLVPALKQGGWLIIEDFDACVDRTLPIENEIAAHAFDRSWQSTWASIEKRGGFADWGRHLGRSFYEIGLCDINVEANFQLVRGGTSFAQFEKLTIERIADEAVSAGWATREEIDRACQLLNDPQFTHFPNVLFSAAGRQPNL